ncbi:MAG: hypothetical protein EXR27_11365 [Betaproteobacteria bacterium]|nr:hypothetical protein [Betaproteobacteria bacterium]
MNGLTLKGGHVIDPASGLNGRSDIRIEGGRITSVGSFAVPPGDEVLDLAGEHVTPGWVDMHVHAYGTLGFADPDSIGIFQGVTTFVEAGGPGIDTLPEFVALLGGRTITTLFAGPYIRPMGIIGLNWLEGEPRSIKNIPVERWIDFHEQHPGLLRYLKIGEFEKSGRGPLRMGKGLAELLNLPLYVHIGEHQRPGFDSGAYEIWNIADKGDIITHLYHNNGGRILDAAGKVYDHVRTAAKRGVLFDSSIGGYNFSWDVAEKAFAQGIVPDFISSDLQQFNVMGPTYSLANVMSIFLHLGFTLPEVIERVTCAPARALSLSAQAGSLRVGAPADITVFRVEDGEFTLSDTGRGKRVAKRRIVPRIAFKDGVRYDVDLTRCQDERNWLMQVAEDSLPSSARRINDRQRKFLGVLRLLLDEVQWQTAVADQLDLDNAIRLQDVFHHSRAVAGTELGESLRAVFDVFLEDPFTMQIGLFLNRLDRTFVLARLEEAEAAGAQTATRGDDARPPAAGLPQQSVQSAERIV